MGKAANVPTSAYLAPFLAGNVKDEVDVMAKGCMRWNTDNYEVGIFVCDTSKCNPCEEDDKPTLYKEDESNQKLVDCNDKVIGCVETKVKNVTNPELYHVMRHCVDRNITSAADHG